MLWLKTTFQTGDGKNVDRQERRRLVCCEGKDRNQYNSAAKGVAVFVCKSMRSEEEGQAWWRFFSQRAEVTKREP